MNINPRFDMTPLARRQLCEDAMARYLPRPDFRVARGVLAETWDGEPAEVSIRKLRDGVDPRIGEVVQVPFVTTMTIVARVTKFGRDWYELEATLISRIVTHKLVEAI